MNTSNGTRVFLRGTRIVLENFFPAKLPDRGDEISNGSRLSRVRNLTHPTRPHSVARRVLANPFPGVE